MICPSCMTVMTKENIRPSRTQYQCYNKDCLNQLHQIYGGYVNYVLYRNMDDLSIIHSFEYQVIFADWFLQVTKWQDHAIEIYTNLPDRFKRMNKTSKKDLHHYLSLPIEIESLFVEDFWPTIDRYIDVQLINRLMNLR